MAKTALSAVGSIAASAMVAHTVLRTYLPQEMQDYIFLGSRSFFNRFTNQLTMIIYEHEGLFNNEIYEAVQLYLTTKISDDTLRVKVSKLEMEKNIVTSVEKNQEITDYYNGVKVKWIWVFEKSNNTTDVYDNRSSVNITSSEVRSFQLSFHKKHKHNIVDSYLPFILEEAKAKKNKNKTVKIHTIDTEDRYGSDCVWTSVNLDHPASFETVAMESNMKEMVMKDLDKFVSRRDYYRKVGKAWKRGYLLYGPPGTGKSSLIAAMANYLNFDIYDLELTDIKRNSELRKILVKTANKSILVVEDIDCTIALQERANSSSTKEDKKHHDDEEKSTVTLSGFLNFIDGLWSSCGDERIIIFTTNHKEKLDPALLRPGRMDLHIHMSYCTPCVFKQLTFNYLGIKDHPRFSEIEDLIAKTEVTPAEVAEQLSKNDDPNVTLVDLIDFLHIKTKENEEAKIKKIQLDKENEEAKIKKMQEEKENKKIGKIEQEDEDSNLAE
jgi:chaperone BCS1